MANDTAKWTPSITVFKYHPELVQDVQIGHTGYEPAHQDFQDLGIEPSETLVVNGNLLTTAGLQRITNLIIASGAQGMTATRTVLGVGNSATGAVVGNTALGSDGASAWYQVVSGAPTAVNGVITATTSFASGDANFAWNEWCIAITNGGITGSATLASTGTTPQIINRRVASMGTKVSGSVWAITATITIT